MEAAGDRTGGVEQLAEPSGATAASQPSGNSGELDAILAEAGWPEHLWPEARAVAWCESKWLANAVSATGDYGLWQINAAAWAAFFGEDPRAWLDPLTNARRALTIYQRGGGWGPWACRWAAR